jgi:hypothetical protein
VFEVIEVFEVYYSCNTSAARWQGGKQGGKLASKMLAYLCKCKCKIRRKKLKLKLKVKYKNKDKNKKNEMK